MTYKKIRPEGAAHKAELREVEGQPAAPDHAQSASEMVVADHTRTFERAQLPMGEPGNHARLLYGASPVRGTIPALDRILSQSEEVTDAGVSVRTFVVGGGDAGARRRWIDGQLFGPGRPEVAPEEPDESQPLAGAGVRVPVPTGPRGLDAMAALDAPSLARR